MLRGNEQHKSGVQRIVFGDGARTVLGCRGCDQGVMQPRRSYSTAQIGTVEVAERPPSATSFSVLAMLNCDDVAVNRMFTAAPVRAPRSRGTSRGSVHLIQGLR